MNFQAFFKVLLSLKISSICKLKNAANIYFSKFNSKTTQNRCEICLKLTKITPELRQWSHSGVFIYNFEQISHIYLVFLLLTMIK